MNSPPKKMSTDEKVEQVLTAKMFQYQQKTNKEYNLHLIWLKNELSILKLKIYIKISDLFLKEKLLSFLIL